MRISITLEVGLVVLKSNRTSTCSVITPLKGEQRDQPKCNGGSIVKLPFAVMIFSTLTRTSFFGASF